MAKNRGEQLHIRIDDAVKSDLKIIADYNGQTMSGMVYQLILQAIRRAKADDPQAFHRNEAHADVKPNNKVVGTITPGKKEPTKEEVRLMYQDLSKVEDVGEAKPVKKSRVG